MTTRKPVCPFCQGEMVRAHIETGDGWRVCWLCDCEPDPEIVASAEAMKEGPHGEE